MVRDITINITDATRPVTQAGFGTGFLLDLVADSAGEYDYTEIRSISDIPANATELAEKQIKAYLNQQPTAGVITVQGVYVDTTGTYTTITEALDAIYEEENDWYGLLLASREQADIEEVAEWCPINKFFITQPVEPSWTELSQYAITAYGSVLATPSVTEQYADAGLMGKMFSKDPGSATWKFQEVNGVISSGYSNADVSSMLRPDEGEPCMIPTIYAKGRYYTAGSKMCDGGYADIKRAIDWLEARQEEAIFLLLLNNDKVGYTNQGISQISMKLAETLDQAVARDVIAVDDEGIPRYRFDAPRIQDIPTNDRANRVIPNLDWDATVVGAVETITVNGTMTVKLIEG